MLIFLICFSGTILALILGLVLKLFVRWDNKFNDVSKKIPGPPPLPLFGNTFQFIRESEKLLPLFDEWAQKYGHRYIYRVGTYWVVGLSNPEDIEKLLTSKTETVKSVDYEQFIPWLGTGLLISNGAKWSTRRKLLTPAFHFKILERFMDVFNQQSLKFVDIIERKFKPGESFEITSLISKLALDIICETAMGVKINAQDQNEDSEYIQAITRIKFLQQYRAMRPWLEPSFIWNMFSFGKEEKRLIEILHNFTNQVIKQRKNEYEVETDDVQKNAGSRYGGQEDYENRKKSAFLDLLLQAQQAGDLKSDEDVREETDTFMFEGHDTVSASLAFSFFLIGNHPDVQSKINEELQTVFGEDQTRPVTMQDLTKLKYLECCIKESLRLYPSVPLIARNIQNNFDLGNEVILPKDTLVVILPYQLHRNQDIYPDPLCYRPERFLSENSSEKSPFAYVPFSAGPRNCIGQKFALMEEKVVLANVLRNFNIRSEQALDELVLMSDLILHSKFGIKMKYSKKSV